MRQFVSLELPMDGATGTHSRAAAPLSESLRERDRAEVESGDVNTRTGETDDAKLTRDGDGDAVGGDDDEEMEDEPPPAPAPARDAAKRKGPAPPPAPPSPSKKAGISGVGAPTKAPESSGIVDNGLNALDAALASVAEVCEHGPVM